MKSKVRHNLLATIVKIPHRCSRAMAVAIILLTTLTLAPMPEAAAQGSLNIFLRMGIDSILDMRPAEARKALKAKFQKVRWKHGDLTPLCGYFRSLKNEPLANQLLAMSLVANEEFEAAEELLSELIQEPNADPWLSSELARVRQLIDVQKTMDFLKNNAVSTTLALEEIQRIEEIVGLPPVEAREEMKAQCHAILSKYGDLTPLLDHLTAMQDSPKVKQLLAIAAMANGKVATAGKALEGLASDPEADVWVLAELGRIREMQGKTQDAIELFERVLEKTEDSATCFALRIRTAQLLYESGNQDAARDALHAITDDPELAGTESRNYCARIAGLHGDYELVAELFQPTGEGKVLRYNRLYLGECLRRIGKPDEARRQFEAALPLAKLSHECRYVLDRIVSMARSMNALPELMDDWLKSDDINPEQLEIMVGILGGELDRLTEVFALIERQNLPAKTRKLIESPGFQARMTSLAMETGRSEFAARTYQDLIEQHPDRYYYRDGYVRLLLMKGDHADAMRVYREATAKTDNSAELMHIAASARRMDLRDIALEAATKSAQLGGDSAINANLFMANLFHEQGETDKALEILRAVEQKINADEDAGRVMMLSREFERIGYFNDAIRLTQKTYELTGSERTLQKLISLLEEQNRHEESYALWRKLWETATEPMTVIQANDRLLEIGAKTGKLADLAVEFEDRLVEGKLRDRELTLLLDIYISVGDPVSAADILMEISDAQGGQTAETLKRLLKVYMECELFGKCNAVLNKLIEIDPDNHDEHLQTLALIALERRNDGDAMVVLEKLSERSDDGILRDSFSASVLNMIGNHEDAARAYRRTVADNPDEVETWLLWGNALAARDTKERLQMVQQRKRPPSPQEQVGHRQTCGVFSVMLEEAAENDLFTIYIDGLLNARATPHTIRNALRRLNERIAISPHSQLLYRLAADLNEDIGRPVESAVALQESLVIAGAGRSIVIRELIAMARVAKRHNEVIDYGRSLLNVTEHLPPAECLSLGTMLLEQGHHVEAETAFQRVRSDVNAVGAARDVVMDYERVGLFNKAAKVIRELLIEEPFDVELVLRLALIEEKRSDFAEAGKAYTRAFDLMIGRLPRRASHDRDAQGDRNVDDIDQYRDLTVRGMIASARTPESRQALLDSVRGKISAEIENLETHEAFAAQVAQNPRLRNLAGLMRRLGIVFHRLNYVNDVDSELIRRYPHDPQLLNVIAGVRRRWQTELDAGEFLAQYGNQGEVYTVAKPFLDGKYAVAKMLDEQSLSPPGRSAATVFSVMFGYDDLIDKTLAGCDLSRTPQKDGQVLVTAGLAANRQDLMRDAVFTNLARLRRELEPLTGKDRSRAYLRPTKVYKQIVAAWPVLSEQDRYTAASLYGMLLEESSSLSTLQGSYHFLLSLSGRGPEISPEHISHYLDRSHFYLHDHIATIIDRWVGDRPADERSATIRLLLEGRDEERRTTALAKLAKYLENETLTDQLRQEFPELAVAKQQAADAGSFEMDTAMDMAQERQRVEEAIDGALLRMGSDVREVFVLHDITMRSAANMLPPEQLDILVTKYKDSRDPFHLLTAFLLLQHAGREMEALSLIQDIADLAPNDPKAEAAVAALPSLLNSYGWNLHAMRITQKNASAPTEDSQLLFKLHDPLAFLGINTKDTLDASSNRVHASRLLGSPDQFKQAVRIYHADTRHPGVVVDYRSELKASLWPDRMATTAGGLLGMKRQPAGTLLADVTRLEGGQDELLGWLQATSPDWYTKETELCKQIAISAGERGLSPQLRDSIQDAAGQSALNCLDIKLIDALASQAPEQLPSELADHMIRLVLHDWRGNSAWQEKFITSRKAMGVHVESSDRMAALAAACHALGMQDLASSLGRWSVAIDLQETGSSKHLQAYLDLLPKEDRKAALRHLLPYMGLNEVRSTTGDGLDQMLAAMLDHGMTDEASEMVDSYLNRRPNVNTTRYGNNSYKEMIGGILADLDAKDDGVAVALARLDRPEDYERLLWQKNKNLKIHRSHLNKSMTISGMPLMDNTNALPEPDQVDDISRYIDIQLALGRRMQSKGILSRTGQVAQICMLGEWCHEHQLDDRVVGLLTQAEAMSEGMLTGRLWVADLQRLVGKETAAEEIELELLQHDLLPLLRVPAALEALARKSGEDAADTVAFRLARYTNHPEVLPRAIRYARVEEMKPEYLDLAQRLRKVNTLFLPPGGPCPFEGYDSVAQWSAAVTATAAKLPATPKPRPLSELGYDRHPAITRVIVKGDNPEMIYVPITHDGPYTHLSSSSQAGVRQVMAECEEIADHIYNRYGVRHVLLEGLAKTFVERYNRIPLQRRSVIEGKNSGMIVHRTWTRLLAEKSWVLVPASDAPITGPLTALGYKYDAFIANTMTAAKENGWLSNRDKFDRNRPALEAEMKTIADEYNAQRRELLEKDPGLKGEYAMTVTVRNKALLDRLLAHDEPGIVFFGAGHLYDLEEQLRERNVSYMVVVPKGLSWPPTKKDDATIYADMLKLGCSLKRCTVNLGDGETDTIIVPID